MSDISTIKVLGEDVLSVKRSIVKQIAPCVINSVDDIDNMVTIGWLAYSAIERGSHKELVIYHNDLGRLARVDYNEYRLYEPDCHIPQIFVI